MALVADEHAAQWFSPAPDEEQSQAPKEDCCPIPKETPRLPVPDLDKAMQKYQPADVTPFTSAQRRWLHVLLGRKDLPQHKKPERTVVAPFGLEIAKDAQESVVKSMRALIANAARKMRH